MKRDTTILASLVLGVSMLSTGCFSESTSPMMGDDDGMAMDESGMAGDDDGMDDGLPPGDDGEPGTDDGEPGTDDGDPGTDGGTTGEGEFEFDESPPEDFTQVDRAGMPAINSAVISDKDVYNASTPADDATGMFVDQIVANLTGLHAALDDDLMGVGLVPCDVETCVAQAAPLVVPDTINIDLTAAAGFPNGRRPADPVMDVTLAVVLLDLSAAGQDALTLVGTNPTSNDVEFSDSFPYFAPGHP